MLPQNKNSLSIIGGNNKPATQNRFLKSIMSLIDELSSETKKISEQNSGNKSIKDIPAEYKDSVPGFLSGVEVNPKEIASDKNISLVRESVLSSLGKSFPEQKDVAMEVLNSPSVNAGKYLPVPIKWVEKMVPDSWMENARNQAYSSVVSDHLFHSVEIPEDMMVPKDKLSEVVSVIGKKNTAGALDRLSWQQKQYLDYVKSKKINPLDVVYPEESGANDNMGQLDYGVFNPRALGYWKGNASYDVDENKMRAFADTLYNTARRIE